MLGRRNTTDKKKTLSGLIVKYVELFPASLEKGCQRFSRKIPPSIGENIVLSAIWTCSRAIKVFAGEYFARASQIQKDFRADTNARNFQ